MTDTGTMKERAKGEFDAWAGTYDRSLLHHFLFQPSYRMFLREVHSWRREMKQPFDLLDIGCGTGQFATMLTRCSMPVRAVGLDYSPNMCQVAAGNVRGLDLDGRLAFLAGDSEHLPFADASFDAVTCSNSFHHYPHQQSVVKEIRRILRPGGRFMLVDGFRDNIVGWFVFDVVITKVEGHVFHAPWSTVKGYFETAGFRDIRFRKFGFWFPLLLTVGTA